MKQSGIPHKHVAVDDVFKNDIDELVKSGHMSTTTTATNTAATALLLGGCCPVLLSSNSSSR